MRILIIPEFTGHNNHIISFYSSLERSKSDQQISAVCDVKEFDQTEKDDDKLQIFIILCIPGFTRHNNHNRQSEFEGHWQGKRKSPTKRIISVIRDVKEVDQSGKEDDKLQVLYTSHATLGLHKAQQLLAIQSGTITISPHFQ